MKKILIIPLLGIKYEGITSVIYNYCYNINKQDLTFEFIGTYDDPKKLIKKFEQIGSVHLIEHRKKDLKEYCKNLRKILKEGNFDVVHIHGNSGTMIFETLIAKICGVKKIIVHCHNTTCDHPVVNRILLPFMKFLATDLMACSDAAGKWLYKSSKYIVLNNAIDIERFKFNEEVRKEYREKLGIKDEIVIGHNGHFHEQKNHSFLIEVFNEYHKINPTAKLLLISDGPLYESIKEKVKKLNLENNVIFTGRISDVNATYQAMDLFILPSLWEGLPVVMLEAQASGLPLLVSNNITKEAKCIEDVVYKNLEDGALSWAKEIESILNNKHDRTKKVKDDFKVHGFDIGEETEKLRKIYLG